MQSPQPASPSEIERGDLSVLFELKLLLAKMKAQSNQQLMNSPRIYWNELITPLFVLVIPQSLMLSFTFVILKFLF
jgi:hypothetical protein